MIYSYFNEIILAGWNVMCETGNSNLVKSKTQFEQTELTSWYIRIELPPGIKQLVVRIKIIWRSKKNWFWLYDNIETNHLNQVIVLCRYAMDHVTCFRVCCPMYVYGEEGN